MRLSPAAPNQPELLSQITGLALIPANAAGAAAVYLFFSYVDPWGGRPQPNAETAFLLFTAITSVLLVVTTRLGEPLDASRSTAGRTGCAPGSRRRRCPSWSAGGCSTRP